MNSDYGTSAAGRRKMAGSVVTLLVAVFGLLLVNFRIGAWLTRVSYDLPFLVRGDRQVDDVVIVYLDELSQKELGQSGVAAWDRTLHAKLIERLTREKAKAVAFDILFAGPSTNKAADAALAEAIRKNGRVVLASHLIRGAPTPGASAQTEELPYEDFRAVAAGWGNANFLADPNLGGKKFFPSIRSDPAQKPIEWLPVTLARLLSTGENVHQGPERGDAWVNFYGPPGTIPGISYFLATLPDGPPPGFFTNKVVFVGGKMSADFSGKGKDEFEVPYSRWGKGLAPGVEIHATAARNILHGEWLRRLAMWAELILIMGVAAFAGFVLIELNPLKATAAAMGGFLVLLVVGCWLAWKQQIWFAWGIGGAQIAVGLFCSILFNSILLYVDKCLLEESLAARVSPRLVKRLMNDAALRRPGGTQQEISILFTDIANFSRLSETMNPDDLVQLMNKYFGVALQCVYESEGTVVKLLGDAIFAIWNAPVEQSDHRERACRTALRLRECLADFRDAHHTLPLRTRVGLHSGSACVGNIGSAQRFDYTAIGDNVNLTARLEGLNKQLGTDVLATREVQRVFEDTLVWRQMGHFKFKGIGRVVEVYELLGSKVLEQATKDWREKFADGLHKFRQRHFEAATTLFREAILLRSKQAGSTTVAEDGPAIFYLEKIEQLMANPPPYEWIGEIELHEK